MIMGIIIPSSEDARRETFLDRLIVTQPTGEARHHSTSRGLGHAEDSGCRSTVGGRARRVTGGQPPAGAEPAAARGPSRARAGWSPRPYRVVLAAIW